MWATSGSPESPTIGARSLPAGGSARIFGSHRWASSRFSSAPIPGRLFSVGVSRRRARSSRYRGVLVTAIEAPLLSVGCALLVGETAEQRRDRGGGALRFRCVGVVFDHELVVENLGGVHVDAGVDREEQFTVGGDHLQPRRGRQRWHRSEIGRAHV